MIPSETIRCEEGRDTNSHCSNLADTVVDGSAYCNECAKRVKDSAKINDACRKVSAIVNQIAKEIGIESLYGKVFGEVHIEGEGWTCDSCVELMQGMQNGGTHHTGYCITPYVEQRATTLGDKQTDFLQYYVQHEEVTRGVHMYPDGSGEPDTSDLVDDLVTDRPQEAAKKAILLYIELGINQMFEAEAEAQMAEAEEDYQRAMYDWYFCQEN